MGDTNKVKFGLKNCYYAKGTYASNGSMSYSTPVALPGAVSLSLEATGEMTPFYADDIAYWISNGNAGYNGDLELAKVPDQFKKDILGFAVDGHGILYEDADAAVEHFALLFEFSGDVHKTRHVMYNCISGRPATGSQTIGENKEPQTESLPITAAPIYNASLDKNIVKANAYPDQTQYNSWNTAVYVATASTN